MTDAFGYDPALHDALCWSICIPIGKPNLFANGMRNSFKAEADAWRAVAGVWTNAATIEYCKGQGYSVVPIAWSYKK